MAPSGVTLSGVLEAEWSFARLQNRVWKTLYLDSIRFDSINVIDPAINQSPKISMASSLSSPSKSNRDDRKRKAPNSSPSSPSSRPKPKSPEEAQEDAIAILKAVIEFRSGHGGSMPTPSTMEPLFLPIKPRLHEHFASADRLHTRFRSLRERFRRAEKAGVGPTPFDRVFFDLSAKAWGASAKVEDKPPTAAASAEEEEEEEEEAAASDCSLKYATGQSRKLWEQLGLSTAALEVGLKFADRAKGAALERRWRAHFEEQLKMQAQSEEVQRNIVITLIDGLKGKREGKSAATS